MQVDIQFFSTFKGISLSQTYHKFRSYSSCSLSLCIRLDIEIIGFVKYQVDSRIQCITQGYTGIIYQHPVIRRKTWRKLNTGIAKQSHCLQMIFSSLLIFYLIETVWEKL